MRTSFAVSTAVWTAAFLIGNYTDVGPAIRGWIMKTGPAKGITESDVEKVGYVSGGQTVDSRMNLVVSRGPGGGGTLMTTSEYAQKISDVAAARAAAAGPVFPSWLFYPGLIMIWVICGFNVITEFNRRPVWFLGKLVKIAGPGLVWYDPIFHTVDNDWSMLYQTSELEIQNLQSHDNVPLSVTAVITYMQQDIRAGVLFARAPWSAMQKRAHAILAQTIAGADLDSILHDRKKLQDDAATAVSIAVHLWGMSIGSLEIRDIKITDEAIQEAIAMKARAAKEADAELTRATMQLKIAEHLNQAAEKYTEHGRWLKQMEAILELTRSAENNTVLMLPPGILGAFGGKS